MTRTPVCVIYLSVCLSLYISDASSLAQPLTLLRLKHELTPAVTGCSRFLRICFLLNITPSQLGRRLILFCLCHMSTFDAHLPTCPFSSLCVAETSVGACSECSRYNIGAFAQCCHIAFHESQKSFENLIECTSGA